MIKFEILGEVRALRDGVPIDLGPAKQRAVLAALLVDAGRPVPVHQIVDAVWGDDPPENGAGAVQKYVAGLRRAFEPDRAVIELTGAGYALSPADGSVDAAEFGAAVERAAGERSAGRPLDAATTLRAGLALWRGDALAGLGGAVFDAVRVRLADAHATAWAQWSAIGLELGRSAALIPELTRLVAEFPLRESFRTHLMLALHRSGRQAEALALFRDSREYLRREAGAEPGPEMRAAHEDILRSAPPTPPPPDPAFVPLAIPHQTLPAGTLWRPARRRTSVGEVVLAAVTPVVTCGAGIWAYFVYAAIRRRDPRLFVVAGAYFVLLVVLITALSVNAPEPTGDEDLSMLQTVAFLYLVVLPIGAMIHGVVLAMRSADHERARTLREQARQMAAFDPERAREIGIGRPAFGLRPFDDGGLVDLNHVDAYELARAARLALPDAQRIVADRYARGPFARPEELIARGLATPRTVRRLAYQLICIAPGV